MHSGALPGGFGKDFPWPWKSENFRIFTFWPGQGPAGPGPDRTEPGDAFESSVSDFEIRPMNKILRAAGLRISFRRAKRASSVVQNAFPCTPERSRGGLEKIFPCPEKVKISGFSYFGRARPRPGPSRAPALARSAGRPGRPEPGPGPAWAGEGGTPLLANFSLIVAAKSPSLENCARARKTKEMHQRKIRCTPHRQNYESQLSLVQKTPNPPPSG